MPAPGLPRRSRAAGQPAGVRPEASPAPGSFIQYPLAESPAGGRLSMARGSNQEIGRRHRHGVAAGPYQRAGREQVGGYGVMPHGQTGAVQGRVDRYHEGRPQVYPPGRRHRPTLTGEPRLPVLHHSGTVEQRHPCPVRLAGRESGTTDRIVLIVREPNCGVGDIAGAAEADLPLPQCAKIARGPKSASSDSVPATGALPPGLRAAARARTP